MGDIIEFTTWPKHQNIFYKITSDALEFHIKGDRNAAIGLSSRLGIECDYWILIGFNQHCWIQKRGNIFGVETLPQLRCNVSTPNILTGEKYRKFWISWSNRELKFGRSNETTPILSQAISMCELLHYVTFSVLGERSALHWKWVLPPQIEKPVLKRLTGGEPQWVKAKEKLPDGALIGGHEDGILYIIRACHRGSLTPGKFVPNLGLGFVSWGGDVHEYNEFEVLCGYNCTWVKVQKNEIPVGAVEGGYSEIGHEILYVGRAECDGHLIPGKVQPSRNCCYVPYNGREVSNNNYEILVIPSSMTQSANSFWLSSINSRIMVVEEPYDSDGDEEEEYVHEDDVYYRI